MNENDKHKCCWCDTEKDRKLVKVTIERTNEEPEVLWICEEHFEGATKYWWS